MKKRLILIGTALVLLLALCLSAPQIYKAYIDATFYQSPRTEAETAVMAFAKENGLHFADYPAALIDLLERNPETRDYVLNYPIESRKKHTVDMTEYENSPTVPLFLQWDARWGYLEYGGGLAGLTACGPVCLSMAAYYLTGNPDYSPDRIIAFAEDNHYYSKGRGSKWTLISEGGKKLGLNVTELPLVKGKIVQSLEAGNPVICVMGPGDFTTTGHFIVLIGMEDGAFRVNDPNSRANSSRLWTYEQIEGQIKNLWSVASQG